ncbi:prepilin peptidase [Vibrio mimicus]|uniref:prepilin peptidase n=1 Tax=Vibrio mimicus TaxID=674 RepID=UPI0003B23961|nr:prepilin peptidase [Vibrio mimicus]AOW84350.1 hypothetical protein VM_16735 [Vibrio mimicus]ERM53018.1 hypothetical protein P780_17560 [Vibrio mimicus CAIM 1882]ERM53194.1 hypothetical protein P781_17510 [Vibrio mimicus CAIM 1883]TXZ07772.1 hypothetical protein FXE63_08510 [Vibrio mimicus]
MMTILLLQWILIAVLLYLSLAVCYSDNQNRKIPNTLVWQIGLCSVLLGILGGYIFTASAHALAVLLLGFLTWLSGKIGGGDIKLSFVFLFGIDPQWLILCAPLLVCLTTLQIVVMGLYAQLSDAPAYKKGIPLGIPLALTGWTGCVLSVITQ